MATVNLPTVSAKVVGDASSLVSELKRGETAASVSSAKIDAEMEKLGNTVKRKFGRFDLARQFMMGLGIGSGFQTLQTSVGLVADYFKQAAESATIVAQQSERATKALTEGFAKRNTPTQNLSALEKEQRILQQRLAGAQQARTDTEFNFSKSFKGAGGLNPLTGFLDLAKVASNISGNFTANLLASQEAERIKAELQELANTIADTRARIKKEADDKAAADLKLLQKETTEMIDDLRKVIFGGREEQALRALDHREELLLKGTRPADPVSDAFLRRGLQVGGASPVMEEEKRQTSLLQKILQSIDRANTAGGGNVPAYNLV